MSSRSENDAFINFLFWVICVAAGIAAVCYLVYWIFWGIAFGVCWVVPYLLFCLLPFGVLSAAYGFGLSALCTLEVESAGAAGSSPERSSRNQPRYRFRRLTHDRRLAFWFPVLVGATFAVFDVPQTHQSITEKVVVREAHTERVNVDGEYNEYGEPARPKYRKVPAVTRDETRIVYQWPWLVDAFNQVNSAWQDRVPFLKQGRPYEMVLFDRNVWSVIAWACLLFGGPFLFFLLSDSDLESEDQALSGWCESAVNAEKNLWENRSETWKKREAELLKHCEDWHAHSEAQKKEIAVLQAKLNFTPEGQQAKAEERFEAEKQKPGVLDSDLL